MSSSTQHNQSPQNVKEEVLLQISDCSVSLVDSKSKLLELALSFSGEEGEIVETAVFLEDFMLENCSNSSGEKRSEIDWVEFAPKAEDYKSNLAKAIAGGTGHIIKGIFTCSNSYFKKVSYILTHSHAYEYKY